MRPFDRKHYGKYADVDNFCVIWLRKGVKGHCQHFFPGSEVDRAFDFAEDLMLDDDNYGIYILESRHYYFKERNINHDSICSCTERNNT